MYTLNGNYLTVIEIFIKKISTSMLLYLDVKKMFFEN